MNKIIIPLVLSLVVSATTMMTTIPVSATSEETPCSPPVMMAGSDRFMVERCNDGAYVIDLEDNSREWTTAEKACATTETGMEFCMNVGRPN